MTSQSELIPTMPGDVLRHERQARGLTVEQVAEGAKIKPSIVSAIEDSNTDFIPAVYLRGYIKSYARFLGIDSHDLEEHMGHVQGALPEVKTVFELPRKPSGSERWLKASSYLVASALIATLAWQFTHEAVRFSQGESPVTSQQADQATLQQEQEATSSSASGNRHLNASIASIEVLKKEETQTPQPDPETRWTAMEEVAAPLTDLADGAQSLRVTTSADTWVEILDSSGGHLEMDLVRADQSRTYSGTPPFRVLIGRASSVRLQWNGTDVDLSPHTRGNVARMTLGQPLAAETAAPLEDGTR